MLQRLRELVYGLNEYEKSRLDERFEIIREILPQVEIRRIDDFELVEEIIFKLKEQLRVRSSNLNKAIIDRTKDLSKEDVDYVIESLNKIKFAFLNKAFTKIEEVETPHLPSPQMQEEVKIEEEPRKELSPISILEGEDHNVYLYNGKNPYLVVEFKEEVDYSFLKKLSSALFDTYESSGTNIIVESKTAMIIPRHINDQLLTLPKIDSDIQEVYDRLMQNPKEEKNEKYVEVKDRVDPDVIKTRKQKEDSLDNLLSSLEPKETRHKPESEEDQEAVKIEKGEADVRVERYADPLTLNPDIQVEPKEEEKKGDFQYVIYKDDSIIVHLNEESQVLGELVVSPTNSKKIRELDEAELSYMTLFAKIFASVLFESVHAHGTNIIWDYNFNSIRIIPRYQEDKMPLKWNPKKHKEEFMEQVKNALISEMAKDIKDPMHKTPVESGKEAEIGEIGKAIEQNKKVSKDEKINYILNAIKRLP